MILRHFAQSAARNARCTLRQDLVVCSFSVRSFQANACTGHLPGPSTSSHRKSLQGELRATGTRERERVRSFRRAYSTASADVLPGLSVPIREDGANQDPSTAWDALVSHVGPKAARAYIIAVDEASGNHLALTDAVPAGCTSLRYVTFEDESAARNSFWWTTALVVGAALKDKYATLSKGAFTLASPVQFHDAGGFALQYLLHNPEAEAETAAQAPGESTLHTCSALVKAEVHRSLMTLRETDLADVEAAALKKAASLASGDTRIMIRDIAGSEAEKLFANNPFKLEELEARKEDARIRIASFGDYLDIVPVDVVPYTGPKVVEALKIQEKSAASWKAVVPTKEPMPTEQGLIRVRAISFPTRKALDEHLKGLERALEADHRTIGREQSLYFTHPSSPGTPFLLPHGMRIAAKIERVIRDLYRHWGYDEVSTPQLYKADLWKQSGHWTNYKEDMFAVEGFAEMRERASSSPEELGNSSCADAAHAHVMDADAGDGTQETAYGLKPMNCPGHCLLFAAEDHHQRELPIRFAEFSPLHRNEASGALSGLTRVRRFHQDDAHVFCSLDQIFGEIASMLTMLREAYSVFGFDDFELVLSTRPVKYLGELGEWNRAEDALRDALNASGLAWTLNEGDGAFYGPKIDIRLVDASGRRHQTATIQLDFQLPKRFELKYNRPEKKVSEDPASQSPQTGPNATTSEPCQPVLIHRAILGSIERFMAIVIETTAGNWPFWLNPRQAVVLPTTNKSEDILAYAEQVRDMLALGETSRRASLKPQAISETGSKRERRVSHTYHVEVDAKNEALGKRVRRAQKSKASFICVVGEEEMQNGTVQVRYRDGIASAAGDGEKPSAADISSSTRKPQLPREMGAYTLQALRELFVALDDHHW